MCKKKKRDPLPQNHPLLASEIPSLEIQAFVLQGVFFENMNVPGKGHSENLLHPTEHVFIKWLPPSFPYPQLQMVAATESRKRMAGQGVAEQTLPPKNC